MKPSEEADVTADLPFNVEVEAEWIRNSVQAIFIGLFVSIPGLIAIYPDISFWRVAMILIGGLAAGFATVFKFSKSV